MKGTGKLLVAICFITLISSCQKEYSFENNGTKWVDPQALAFIDSSGITDSLQQNAVNNLVIQLKSDSLWSKFLALYPMVGGTPGSTKWNLKDPRDLDAAFRLTFYGSPLFSAGGVLFATLSDYASTHFTDNLLSYNNASIAYYSTTQNSSSGYDMGCDDNVAPYNELAIYEAYDASDWFGYYKFGWTPANTAGLFMFSATANNVERYENGVVADQKGASPTNAYTNLPILLGKVANAAAGGKRQCSFAAIGEGLSDNEALAFYNDVQAFETQLGR